MMTIPSIGTVQQTASATSAGRLLSRLTFAEVLVLTGCTPPRQSLLGVVAAGRSGQGRWFRGSSAVEVVGRRRFVPAAAHHGWSGDGDRRLHARVVVAWDVAAQDHSPGVLERVGQRLGVAGLHRDRLGVRSAVIHAVHASA